VALLASDQSRYLITLRPGEQLHTHQGVFHHDDVVGRTFGATITSSLGHPGLLLEPSLDDLMRHLKRNTQIIYPKDAAYLVYRLNLRAGSTVIEAGTGSGGLTMALAWAVAPTGRVYTYEVRDDAYQAARRNLERAGLLPFVEMHLAGAEEGFKQRNVDALFLDVREPWLLLEHVRAALRPGGFFAGLLPTTNQVSALIEAMERTGFADLAVEELLLRAYKPAPDRLRPVDTMPAHTGYLVFGRPLVNPTDAGLWLPKARQRYLARLQAEQQVGAESARRSQEQSKSGAVKYPKLPLPG
jgi:tRNA (adenine57-N1/adenine58-N1)-methyltransferase